MKKVAASLVILLLSAGCGRFSNRAPAASSEQPRIVCISQQYNEIIYALGAEQNLVGVDYSSTYPPEIRNVQTVGYHRALSAEGILSLRPTVVINDGNIGPPSVLQQLAALRVPTKSFSAKDDSIDGLKALIREMGAYFHKEARAEQLCAKIDADLATGKATAAHYQTHPKVVVIHFGRASNVYLTVRANGGNGDGGAAGQMVAWAGGVMAIQGTGMERMTSPETIAKANPDVILMTDYGYDRLGSLDAARTLPGVAETNAARTGRIYRVTEHDLMYYNPDSGESIARLAALIHKGE
ncbi:MAG: ABC transporter substrate-binding protein [Acidobacteriota bacterium]|nr:ABC transporter substrate-binding protein [Acidobacteriota bacterium]